MKSAGLIAVLMLAASIVAVAAFARTPAATPTPTRCGGELWRLKTFSDPGRTSVALTPKTTTIGAIVEKPFPRPVPRKRRTAFQRQNWEVVAQVTAFRLEDAGLRLVLYDHGAYVNAVIPAPSCLTRVSRARTWINDAWTKFVTGCIKPTRDWQALGAIVYIRGVGLWSERSAERGAAPNGAELYPVTGFRVVVGCR